MTPTQQESIDYNKKHLHPAMKMEVLGEDEKGNIIIEIDAPAFTQRAKIGKRGAYTWAYKFTKI